MSNEHFIPQNAQLSWRDNGQPWSQQFEDVYFSAASGIEESRYVFLDQNNLENRWQHLAENEHFIILETGFGTGLNFLSSWHRWLNCHAKSCIRGRLHFISIEKFPLSAEDLKRSLELWPELQSLSQQLIANYPPTCVAGIHKIVFGNVTLTLYFGDILDGLAAFLAIENAGPEVAKSRPSLAGKCFAVDAIYLDGFSPATNPEMWCDEVFSSLARLSHNNTHFSTFTSAGKVKRGLQSQGFICEKVKGFGNKREMLRGIYSGNQTHAIASQKKTESSWHILPANKSHSPDQALIIGGGLAGCHLAFALAVRGVKVRLVEKHKQLAQEASGNKRGVIYTRLSPHSGPLSEFNLRALLFACQYYESYGLFKKAGNQCGVLHLSTSEKERAHFVELGKQFLNHPHFLRFVNAEVATSLAGVSIEKNGIFLAKSGWLDPGKLCKVLCDHKNIEVLTGHTVKNIDYTDHTWQLKVLQASETSNPTTFTLQSPLLVIANAAEATHFSQSALLPLKKIRGQVSYSPLYSGKLPTTAICAEGYVTALDQEGKTAKGLCFGASFNLHDDTQQLTQRDHEDNLLRLLALSSDFPDIPLADLEGKVGFRCTSPDYFPLVGPLAQEEAMRKRFAALGKRAKARIDACGEYQADLFCLLALGSRGLAYAPLVADSLASAICGEPLPVSRKLWRHIHPARFVIRNLIRNQAAPEDLC